MSGRGRGRGRGRSSAPASVSQQFLLRSAQEAGFDVRNLRALNNNSGRIFPDLEWHSSGERRSNDKDCDGGGETGAAAVKQEPNTTNNNNTDKEPVESNNRSPQQIYLISKSRELHHKFQSSIYYVRPPKDIPDVIRYSDPPNPPNIDSGAVLSHCLGGRKRTRAGVFVPEELCGGQRTIVDRELLSRKRKLKELNLEELAKKIRTEGDVVGGVNEEEEGGGDGDDEVLLEEEEEESTGADYEKNYYESEGDESAGSDGEPTF